LALAIDAAGEIIAAACVYLNIGIAQSDREGDCIFSRTECGTS